MNIEDFNRRVITKQPIKTESNDTIHTKVNWPLVERIKAFFLINGPNTDEQCRQHLGKLKLQSTVRP